MKYRLYVNVHQTSEVKTETTTDKKDLFNIDSYRVQLILTIHEDEILKKQKTLSIKMCQLISIQQQWRCVHGISSISVCSVESWWTESLNQIDSQDLPKFKLNTA